MSASWLHEAVAGCDGAVMEAARTRQETLTKPAGSLGRLEELAVRLAGLQRRLCPQVVRARISIFAGDHGVAEEGVSAFPQAVTVQMLQNFAAGGAAISVLARALDAELELVDCGTAADASIGGVLDCRAGRGTANLSRQPAMTLEQVDAALVAGRVALERAEGADVFIGGEMGIANTTAATALACALLGAAPMELAGPGAGLDPAGVARKITVLSRALDLHRDHLADPLEALRRLGGFEIAALVGAYVRAAQRGVPVLVDGFISSVAALVATRINSDVATWLIYTHQSAEPGHARVLAALGAEPLVDLGMRLGEASGAAVALPLLRLACALHAQMATFAEAGVAARLDSV